MRSSLLITLVVEPPSFAFCLRFSRAVSAIDCPWQMLATSNVGTKITVATRNILGLFVLSVRGVTSSHSRAGLKGAHVTAVIRRLCQCRLCIERKRVEMSLRWRFRKLAYKADSGAWAHSLQREEPATLVRSCSRESQAPNPKDPSHHCWRLVMAKVLAVQLVTL